MARSDRTTRKRVRLGATPADVIQAYLTYEKVDRDLVVEFMAHFQSHWEDAYEHGVSHLDGIRYLIDTLSSDWKGYAREVSGDYIHRQGRMYDLEGDFSRFLSHLIHVGSVHRGAPRGPYLPPRECTPLRDAPEWLYQDVPASATYVMPLFQPFGAVMHDHEAGPSRPRALEAPLLSPPGFALLFSQDPLFPFSPPLFVQSLATRHMRTLS